MASDSTTQTSPKWHFWLIAVLALLWCAMGCFDYIMTETHNASYMSQFSKEQLDFFYSIPAWSIAFWAIAVWGGLIGSLLLLMRRRLSVPIYLISLIGTLVSMLQMYVLSDGMKYMGDGMNMLFTVAIIAISIFLYFYARRCGRVGILR